MALWLLTIANTIACVVLLGGYARRLRTRPRLKHGDLVQAGGVFGTVSHGVLTPSFAAEKNRQ